MSAAVIEAFAKTARPIMRQFMSANSCIGAARTTIEVMRLYGLRAVEKPVCYAFQVPARKYARVSGFSAEARAEMEAKATSWRDELTENGWNGHLLVLVEDRWLIDAAIDQADAPEFGVPVPPEIFVVDTKGRAEWNPLENFEAEMVLVLDSGDRAELRYCSIGNRDYRDSEAWTDEGLPLLAHLIATEMERVSGCVRESSA